MARNLNSPTSGNSNDLMLGPWATEMARSRDGRTAKWYEIVTLDD